VTLAELLRATFHIDVLTAAKPQICQRHDCGVRFTGRGRKFCSDECARVVATRNWRKREKETKLIAELQRQSGT
jgi:hypothetical protein